MRLGRVALLRNARASMVVCLGSLQIARLVSELTRVQLMSAATIKHLERSLEEKCARLATLLCLLMLEVLNCCSCHRVDAMLRSDEKFATQRRAMFKYFSARMEAASNDLLLQSVLNVCVWPVAVPLSTAGWLLSPSTAFVLACARF